MPKLLLILALIPLLIVTPVWGATSTTQWDVRSTGANTNGGGFDPTVGVPGTDYSQQNGVQYTFTDLLIGTPNSTFTSALNPVVAGMVGNTVRITAGSGCTVGIKTIISQAAGVATTETSLGTIGSVCTAVIGGSLQTIAGAVSAVSTQSNDDAQGVVWVKAGTYTQTTALACNTAPWVAWVGYNSTHGDYSATRPLITTATNSTVLCEFNNTGTNGGQTYKNINFSNTAGTRAAAFNSSQVRGALQLINCTFDGFSTAISSATIGAGGYSSLILDGVEIKNSTGTGIEMGVVNTTTDVFRVANSWIHNNGGAGITVTRIANTELVRNLITDNTGDGVIVSGSAGLLSLYLDSNTIANNTGDGLDISGGGTIVTPTANALVATFIHRNNLYYGNGNWGVRGNSENVQNTPIMSGYNNAYGGNSSGATTGITAGLNDVTLSANPFASATDYSLNATAGGGLSAKGAGYPGAFPGGLSTGSLDIGAVQTPATVTATQRSFSSSH